MQLPWRGLWQNVHYLVPACIAQIHQLVHTYPYTIVFPTPTLILQFRANGPVRNKWETCNEWQCIWRLPETSGVHACSGKGQLWSRVQCKPSRLIIIISYIVTSNNSLSSVHTVNWQEDYLIHSSSRAQQYKEQIQEHLSLWGVSMLHIREYYRSCLQSLQTVAGKWCLLMCSIPWGVYTHAANILRFSGCKWTWNYTTIGNSSTIEQYMEHILIFLLFPLRGGWSFQ